MFDCVFMLYNYFLMNVTHEYDNKQTVDPNKQIHYLRYGISELPMYCTLIFQVLGSLCSIGKAIVRVNTKLQVVSC